MTDVPPPTTPPPPSAPPPYAGPPPPAGQPLGLGAPPPPTPGLPTGVKIAIGCGIALIIVLILMFACFGLAARFVGKKAEDLNVAMENQQEAQEMAQRLETEHAFTPPASGELDEGLVDDFFAVTDDAWSEIEGWVRDMEERGQKIEAEQDQAGFGDAMAAMQGMGNARVAIVEALEDNGMAPSAYVWTGFTLMQAHAAAQQGGQAGVPEKNVAIARDNAERLAELEDSEKGKGTVLGLAYVYFPRMDVLGPGLDSIPTPTP